MDVLELVDPSQYDLVWSGTPRFEEELSKISFAKSSVDIADIQRHAAGLAVPKQQQQQQASGRSSSPSQGGCQVVILLVTHAQQSVCNEVRGLRAAAKGVFILIRHGAAAAILC